MQRILAKSNPEKELYEHTLEVIQCAEREIYNLRLLGLNIDNTMEKAIKICCFAHDLGKVSRAFQDSLSGSRKYIPHNLLSVAFLKTIFDQISDIPDQLKNKIIYAVGFHHKNFLELSDFINDSKRAGTDGLEDELIDIETNRLHLLKPMQELFKEYFNADIKFSIDYSIIDKLKDIIFDLNPFDKEIVHLKGILHRADHIASAGINEESKIYLNSEAYKTLKLKITPKKFQEEIVNKGESLLLIAPTGSGKTEAALCWAGNRKGKIIFTLPTRASVNAAFRKLQKYYGDDVGILHGEAGRFIYSTLRREYDETEALEESIYEVNLCKNLLKPIVVTTIDQIFSFALRVHQYEKVLMGLYGANIVLDEIDSYSPYTIEILKQSLKIARQFDINFLIMSATIPDILKEELKKEGIVSEEYIPEWEEIELKNESNHEIQIINDDIINCYKTIKDLSNGERESILIVCNTIKKAVYVYEKLKDLSPKLYHSLFTFDDREIKEAEIAQADHNGRSTGIWITTQVVEVSLDLDFDVLITEAAPVNALIQRMGRCYRKRKGVGKVFIYSKSINDNSNREFYPYGELAIKESLKAFEGNNGVLTWQEKLKILNNYFKKYWQSKKIIDEKTRAKNIVGAFLSSDLTMLETVSNNEVSRFLRDSGVLFNVIPVSKLEDSEIEKLNGNYKWRDRDEKLTFLYQIRGKIISVPIYSLLKFRSFFEETRYGMFLAHLDYNSETGLNLKTLPSNFG
ncbi:CRISPR-associated helicase/endonuclease Cas3 [Thermodesulfobacterium thermophilum]|uniref:CRISPR-associated helicase/endonuclease Cas3 n=1 Tax=Thermodesulfobacterium thermophilum TaxID=886 RepID=UPI0003B34F9D|nr:CRISPR-associated helicase/endonuclease Cas3 [Thermodesulfobacterium thermophilum]